MIHISPTKGDLTDLTMTEKSYRSKDSNLMKVAMIHTPQQVHVAFLIATHLPSPQVFLIACVPISQSNKLIVLFVKQHLHIKVWVTFINVTKKINSSFLWK